MSLPKHKLTAEQYLEIERKAEIKSEFYRGEMFAMSGASEAHNMVVTNLSREISTQFKGRNCRNYSSDMRVRIKATGLYSYPDLVAVCGEPEFDDDHFDTLLNPGVIIEVLSPSTEAYDRGDKSWHYRQIPSLGEYLLVAQNKYHIEHYVKREEGRWLLSETDNLQDVIHIASIDCRLPVAEVYDTVVIETERSPEQS